MSRNDAKVRQIVREELDKVVGELLVRFYFGDAFGAAEANEQEIEISPEDLGITKKPTEKQVPASKRDYVRSLDVGTNVFVKAPRKISLKSWHRRWYHTCRAVSVGTLPSRAYDVHVDNVRNGVWISRNK